MPWCPQRLRGDPSRETDARPSASSLTTRRLNRSAYLLNDTLSAVNWMPGRGSVARERRHNLTRPTSKVSSLHFDSPRAMELPFRERTCQRVKSRVRMCRHPAKGISGWDEPCTLPATKHCERCPLGLCDSHFGDPDWHPCA